jgi:hypothetical protein
MSGACIVMLAVLARGPGVPDRIGFPVNDGRDGAHGSVEVRSEMGKRFRLTDALLILDGQEVARRTAAPGQELERTFRLWSSDQPPIHASERVASDGLLRAGGHAVTVRLTYEGRNVGPFSYLDDYKMRAESTFAFEVGNPDRPAALQVIARERANPKAPLRAEPSLTIEPAVSADPSAPPSKEPRP